MHGREIRQRIGNQDVGSRGESMKRTAIVIAVLGMCGWSFGQSNGKPATQNPPAGQAAQPAQPAGQAAGRAGRARARASGGGAARGGAPPPADAAPGGGGGGAGGRWGGGAWGGGRGS